MRQFLSVAVQLTIWSIAYAVSALVIGMWSGLVVGIAVVSAKWVTG